MEIMNYILNIINILVYINSASNHTSSASVMLLLAYVVLPIEQQGLFDDIKSGKKYHKPTSRTQDN